MKVQLTLEDVIKSAMAAKPAVFGKVGAKRATLIVRAALRTIVREISNVEDGSLSVENMGTFRARQAPGDANARKRKGARVVFVKQVRRRGGRVGGGMYRPR